MILISFASLQTLIYGCARLQKFTLSLSKGRRTKIGYEQKFQFFAHIPFIWAKLAHILIQVLIENILPKCLFSRKFSHFLALKGR